MACKKGVCGLCFCSVHSVNQLHKKIMLGGTWQVLDPQGKKSGEATHWQRRYLSSF